MSLVTRRLGWAFGHFNASSFILKRAVNAETQRAAEKRREEELSATLCGSLVNPQGCQSVAGGRRGVLGGGDLRIASQEMSCTLAGC
jgi:hypothetical protein